MRPLIKRRRSSSRPRRLCMRGLGRIRRAEVGAASQINAESGRVRVGAQR